MPVAKLRRSRKMFEDDRLGDRGVQAVPGAPAGNALLADARRERRRLRDLASDSGCETLSQCKTVPVGERACGGPREYVVYCAVSTDEDALLAVAESVTKLTAVCVQCGGPANRTQRLTAEEGRVVVGAAESYEARCRRCHEPHGNPQIDFLPRPMPVKQKSADDKHQG